MSDHYENPDQMPENENPEETKIYIRNFIFEKYGRQMESILEEVERDLASYSQPDEYSKLIAVQDRNYDELIPVSAFVTRAIIVDGRTVISPGFYDSYDSLLKCVEIVAASSGKFMLSHVKGIWADKGRRKGTKPIVKPIP